MNSLSCAIFLAVFRRLDADFRFDELQGQIDDCQCSVDTVDYFNNVKLFPRLMSLLENDYFRYYQVNLKRPCPFWADNMKCSLKDCHVKACPPEDLPIGVRNEYDHQEREFEAPHLKYSEAAQLHTGEDCDDSLGFLNKTISDETSEAMKKWKAYDAAAESFCDIGDGIEESMEFVDLRLNPERYTGYKGESAWRIWKSIYEENCFKMVASLNPFDPNDLQGVCLERRVFYRAVSGLHSSINVHLSANYLLNGEESKLTLGTAGKKWGPNLREFQKRFDPEKTNGQGPQRLRNLYFLYLLELRALAKAAPYLEEFDFFTGKKEDEDVGRAVQDILRVIKSFPNHFNELSMFVGDDEETQTLKGEFRKRFMNITRIMDCVGCDKCKLWGKLQIHGLGTALKILFSGSINSHEAFTLPEMKKAKFQLSRNEVVALVNAFGRLSSSIYHLEQFRSVLRT